MFERLFNKTNKEDQFWKWFQSQSDKYYHFEKDQDLLFQQLSSKLMLVNPGLVFEFSPILENGTREFIISADGIKDVFPSVIKLVNVSPVIEKWKIIAFRQPNLQYSEIAYDDISISLDDVFFRYVRNNRKLDVEINIRGFQKSNKWGALGFLLLDFVVGEYDTEMSLGYIDLMPLDEANLSMLLPITELPKILKEHKVSFSN